ncbi:MAG TPA: hypothetical protein VNZ64_13935 [Candidatus Acidoferrum sp.]|jgi:hypothetical protein|nr:hypothetical protein [Candidatus Acidoferrum sp.]
MKLNTLLPLRTDLCRLALGLAATALAAGVASATPYATSLTNNGTGTISFRLNQTTGTNDLVQVISGGGTVTNSLQLPSGDPANILQRGLIVTNLGVAPGAFQVRIKHTGSGVISTNSPSFPFNSPRGISVNNRPASPYFGRVYVANSAAGTKGKGMFAFSSDLSDILGQGATAMTGGYTFGANDLGAPYHTSVAPDDSVLVSDASDTSGNLISMPPDLSSFNYVLKQIEGPSFAVSPVGSNNVHGTVQSGFIVGSGSSRKLYTMDEDYQTDPTAAAATEWNSAWEYDIGSGPLPWSNAPNRKLMTPYLASFAGQNEKVEVNGHYLYANQRRSNPPQHSAYIVDLNNLQDPGTFTGATPWGMFWTSQGESLAEGYSDDVLRDTMTTSVSPDGKWFATIIAAGSATITAPDGTTFANAANDIILIPLTNGVPNIPAHQVFHFGGLGNGRDLAFDAAHNLYCVSSGLGILQSLDIGESTDCTTSSDGTFSLATPATQVSVAASTPVAYEQGAVPGVFTITRTPDDIGNPVTVFYTLTGTAQAGTNYVAITNNVTIAAGATSTNILITPINDGHPDLTLTTVLTIKGSGGYSVGFPLSATVYIADNSTPQLQIVSLSTNIFEGNTNDYAAMHLRRFGDTNVQLTLDASSFTFGGTARSNVDYYLANLPITINPGVVDVIVPLVYPLRASTAVGSLSVVVTNLAGTGYTVTNNTATTTITLEALPPGTVLFSDNFEGNSSANWNVVFQSYTNGSTDYNVVFGYDYTSGSLGNLSPIPAAPHSTNADTKGLYMTVNKNAMVSAGLNLYLKNHTFGSNYALRFDMFLVENSAGTAQSKVENALFGINHDGAHTNWFRNAVTGTSLLGSPTASDGLFFDVGADGSGGGGAPYDFAAWSGPTYTNTVNVVGPTNFLARLATTTTNIFKRPPFDSGTVNGGDPANTIVNPTPTWTQVEVSQVGTIYGNLITWRMNNTVILQFTNNLPNTIGVTNGTVMLGYVDPWDDLGNSSAGSGEGCVIIDNVQVVQLSPATIISQPTNALADLGGTATFTVAATTVTGVTNYQWYSNSVAIANATNSSLTVSPTTSGSYAAAYSVLVNDGAYSIWSTTATVHAVTLPSIITPPATRAAVVGSSPTFSVTARTSSGTTNYQWMYYGTNLAGATTRTFTLTSVQPVSFNGPYTVRVNDGFNSVTSSPPATLTFAVSPDLAGPARTGNNFSFSFGTQIGPSYVLDYKSALTNASWVPVGTNAGTGGILSVTNTSVAPQGYYRIRLQ